MLFCGIVMKPYLKENLSISLTLSIKYFTKMMAVLFETVVFLFLGLSTITTTHDWDTHFVLLAIIFGFVARFIGMLMTTIVFIYSSISATIQRRKPVLQG
jgi:sodium/hydrogen exchanger-like protein 3